MVVVVTVMLGSLKSQSHDFLYSCSNDREWKFPDYFLDYNSYNADLDNSE